MSIDYDARDLSMSRWQEIYTLAWANEKQYRSSYEECVDEVDSPWN